MQPFKGELTPGKFGADYPYIHSLESEPGVVVRQHRFKNVPTRERLSLANQLFNDFEGADVPFMGYVYGQTGEGDSTLYMVSKEVKGSSLLDALSHGDDEVVQSAENLYVSQLHNIMRLYSKGGEYLSDVWDNQQYRWGTTPDNPNPKLYMIDVEPFMASYMPGSGKKGQTSLDILKDVGHITNMIVEAKKASKKPLPESSRTLYETLETLQAAEPTIGDNIRQVLANFESGLREDYFERWFGDAEEDKLTA